MAYVKESKLYDADGNLLKDSVLEVLQASSALELGSSGIGDLSVGDIYDSIHSHISVPLFKLFLLNDDESEQEDISEYVIASSLNFSHEYKSGQRRSLTFDLDNTSGRFFPNPISNRIWLAKKLKFFVGLLCKDVVYWYPNGIFLLSEISLSDSNGGDVVSLQAKDKFARIDGTLSGKLESDYEIPNGTLISDTVASLLKLDSGNGDLYDAKELVFSENCRGVATPYTIKHSPGSTVGKIILELCEIISCDVYYNENGNLVVESADELLNITTKPIVWHYGEKDIDYVNVNMKLDFSSVVNKITVVGAVVNGDIYKYTAENTNAASPTNIYFTPISFEYISDDNIYSEELCRQRAMYELQKKSILPMSVSFTSIYIPFIAPGELFAWTSSEYNFKYEKFLISSIQMKGDGLLSIAAVNASELPFNL